jgi:nitroreductase
MEFFDLIRNRRSIRSFKEEPPSLSAVDAILEAVRTAPSAGNIQAFRIKVVRDAKSLQGLSHAAYGQGFISQAPLALVFMADKAASQSKYGQRGRDLYCVQDATIACLYAHLAASAVGLASAWIGAFSHTEVSELLGLPDHLLPVAILPMGYPAETPESTPRKTVGELLI